MNSRPENRSSACDMVASQPEHHQQLKTVQHKRRLPHCQPLTAAKADRRAHRSFAARAGTPHGARAGAPTAPCRCGRAPRPRASSPRSARPPPRRPAAHTQGGSQSQKLEMVQDPWALHPRSHWSIIMTWALSFAGLSGHMRPVEFRHGIFGVEQIVQKPYQIIGTRYYTTSSVNTGQQA